MEEETPHKAVFRHPSLGHVLEQWLHGLGKMSRGLGRSFSKRGPMRRLLEAMLRGLARTSRGFGWCSGEREPMRHVPARVLRGLGKISRGLGRSFDEGEPRRHVLARMVRGHGRTSRGLGRWHFVSGPSHHQVERTRRAPGKTSRDPERPLRERGPMRRESSGRAGPVNGCPSTLGEASSWAGRGTGPRGFWLQVRRRRLRAPAHATGARSRGKDGRAAAFGVCADGRQPGPVVHRFTPF